MTMRIRFGAVLATAAAIGAAAGCTAVGCTGRENADRAPAANPGTKEQTMGESTGNPVVILETSMGTIRAELWADKAPKTVANFLRYADEGFYDGLIFHRVIPGFMIQGGGFEPGMKQKATHAPVVNEARPELRNDRGTLAMARTSEPNSATAQFFINLVDNDFLNQRNRSAEGFGYCAFGKVVEGLDAVDKIGGVKTGRSGHFEDVPVEAVVIRSARRAE